MSLTYAVEVADDEYSAYYCQTHDRVFSPEHPSGLPFRPEWRIVPLPGGLFLDADIFRAIALMAREAGDDTCIVVDPAGTFPHQKAMRMPWQPEALDEVRGGTSLGHVDVDVFGRSGRWGLFATVDGYAILGADAELLDHFYSASGGVERIRKLFLEAIEIEELGRTIVAREHAERLASSAGW